MLFPLKLAPGVLRNGTEYASKGRYYDAWLVRWTDDGTLKPIGGWATRSSAAALTGAARALQTWRDNNNNTWIQIGTHSHLYVQDRSGTVSDITPAGFVSGRADATAAGGYGQGNYQGGSNYGGPTPDNTLIQDATQWTLDTFGQNPVGVSPDDNKIYSWDLNTAHVATQLSNSPTCNAIVVTAERFVFALGAGDNRTVQWCDQENDTSWTPSVTNQAGSFPLQTGGRLLCGKAVKGGTLLLTDIDAHLATYIGGTLIYAFDRVGTGCGAASRQAIAALGDGTAVWMGSSGFWLFNGYVQPLACDAADFVFANLNTQQISKVYCIRDAANSEVEWHFPTTTTENDTVVVWNYKFNYWNIGRKARTAGADRGVFPYPIKVDSAGLVYNHEFGFTYDGTFPYAEGGPLEFGSGFRPDLSGNFGIGQGDTVLYASWLLPDDKTLGDVTATFKTKFEPDDTEVVNGPNTLSARTAVRFCARQVKVRFTGAANDDWRVGVPRLDASAGGER